MSKLKAGICKGMYIIFGATKITCVADRQRDMAVSIQIVVLNKNIYSLWGLPSPFQCVTNFTTK